MNPIFIFNSLRKYCLKKLSGNYRRMTGKPFLNQALLIMGEGMVHVGNNVQIGYEPSPGYWSGYAYFDLRGEKSVINIEDNVVLNNNTSLTADGASISIGKNTLVGVNLSVMTSDGHALSPSIRKIGSFPCLPVSIGENVFIGDNVMILKGVNIGRNAVIGAGSVVTSDIPENAVAAGNPCRVIRILS